MKQAIALTVNGDVYEVLISPNQTLLEVLRDKLGLTGTKKGCDLGACGACSVLLDGEAYLSCLMLAVDAVGKEIVTIEGLSEGGDLHPIQKSFVELGGLQCGFCTPGIVMTAKAILDEEPQPTEESVKKKMAGNLCRCTGYKKVIESVMSASGRMGGKQ
ncbi:MAG: (2Fe-2S)-binding protein [Desulfomonile tiedjei]|uniref:(2Fe-2S)-binding protein n=1 Tax=Desulfomonile tiedjei TaxID=2358 RepID=A0A9D6V5B4_9BACT|nr:(2Fe-2S)-binding protein [Desulfomonile tiedjei]